jgi:hypothetical protein
MFSGMAYCQCGAKLAGNYFIEHLLNLMGQKEKTLYTVIVVH